MTTRTTTSITVKNFQQALDEEVVESLVSLAEDKEKTSIMEILKDYGVDKIESSLIYGKLRKLARLVIVQSKTEESKENTNFEDDKIMKEAKKKADKQIKEAMDALFDDDKDEGAKLLKLIQEQQSTVLDFLASISTKTKIISFLGSIAITGTTNTGSILARKIVKQLTVKGCVMIGVNAASVGLAALNFLYMVMLWYSMSQTSDIIKKEVPDIITVLKQEKEKLRSFAIKIGGGELLEVSEIDKVKVNLENLNERCIKCIDRLSKWEIGFRKLKVKLDRKKFSIGAMVVGVLSAVAAAFLIATGVGSILIGCIAGVAGIGLAVTGGLAYFHSKDCDECIKGIKEIMNVIKGLQLLVDKFRRYTLKENEIDTKKYDELLTLWQLSDYTQNFKDKGWVDVKTWKELSNEILITDLKMKKGHAAKFMRLCKKTFHGLKINIGQV